VRWPVQSRSSTTLRVLHEVGLPLQNREGCTAFLTERYDPTTAGFAFEPGGALNLPPTAMGHVALVMLGLAIVSVIGIHAATTAAPVFAEIAAQR
jgi:hypothetical protein